MVACPFRGAAAVVGVHSWASSTTEPAKITMNAEEIAELARQTLVCGAGLNSANSLVNYHFFSGGTVVKRNICRLVFLLSP